MIQLHPDYLLFETSEGDSVPCSAEVVTIELMGESVSNLDPGVVKEAAAAVVHYFKDELGREHVSVAEFSGALEKALSKLGFTVVSASSCVSLPSADLATLATECVPSRCELVFFQRLREEFKKQIGLSPEIVRFTGLRKCVKTITGNKRWCGRCEDLSDQIVTYLRECLVAEAGQSSPGLVVV